MENFELQEAQGKILARITAVHRELFEVSCEKGETTAVVKRSIYDQTDEVYPAIGDFVYIDYNPSGPSRIVKTLERKSYFSRKDPDVGRGEQVVAANFDYVFIVMSLNNDFNTKRLDRYLTATWQSGAVPVVILTKTDLAEDYSWYMNELEAVAIGVDIVPISAKTGFGLKALEKYMQPGQTVVFLGSSGVDKSSLVNVLMGKEVMKTNGIREDDAKGHHTTTYRQLLKLSNGAMIIDTPGMRELGMWDVRKGLGENFKDIEALMLQCKFSNCTHGGEPGCKICEALENGSLDQARWQSYLKLKKDAKYSEDKIGYRQEMKKVGKAYAKQKRMH